MSLHSLLTHSPAMWNKNTALILNHISVVLGFISTSTFLLVLSELCMRALTHRKLRDGIESKWNEMRRTKQNDTERSDDEEEKQRKKTKKWELFAVCAKEGEERASKNE